jgi:hypothetical protein
MSFSSLFLILFLALTIIQAETITDDSCETHISKLKDCDAIISFAGDCQSSIVSLNNTEYAKCTSNTFFWSYPVNNMTLIIETPSTRIHQAYTIALDNEQLIGALTNVYRIINNQEIEITTQDKTLIQHSDSNYEIILKFQARTHLSRYGVNIIYKTV